MSVLPPPEVTAWGEYIYTIADWTDSTVLRFYFLLPVKLADTIFTMYSVTWMNRIQTESIISECREKEEGSAWQCARVFSEREQEGWIEIESPPVYKAGAAAGDTFIQILSSLQPGDNRHWRHIARINKNTGETTFLTEGGNCWIDNLSISFYFYGSFYCLKETLW